MLNRGLALLAVLLGLAAFGAQAQGGAAAEEAQLRKTLQAKFPQMTVESITRTPFAGLFEVVLSGEVVYTDARGEYLMGGTLYDLRAKEPRNITAETQQKLAAKVLAGSHENAIRWVRGNGRRVLYTFEDPNCGYCRKLYKEINKMTDVTIYTFLLPVLSQDSAEKSRAVWCARDRVKAWDQMMVKGALAEPSKPCDAPLDKNAQVAQRLNIRGTPAIFLQDGRQLGGYLPDAQLEQALARK
ncbi:MAG: DsbC family protein [Betaproteobacteria bacterium]|nr:DsbC family protein [Betaproteobacteria bacterium]